MSVQAWTFVMVGLSFAIYIGVAIWSRASSTGEFYIAGAGVPPVVNGMATAADWMSAASFISMAGLISFMGRDGSVYLMGWTGGYVLLALLLAPYLRNLASTLCLTLSVTDTTRGQPVSLRLYVPFLSPSPMSQDRCAVSASSFQDF